MEQKEHLAQLYDTGTEKKSASRFVLVMVFSVVMLAVGLVLNIGIGSVAIPAQDIFRLIWDGIRGIATDETATGILFTIRVPRMLLAAVLGGALAVSGYLLQVFFRNPIAGPFVLGISSGAKMAVGITLIFLAQYIGNISSYTLIFAAFIGALIITFIVLMLSGKVRNMSMLLVIGIMVGYICSAVTDLCVTFASEHDVVNLTGWAMGSFSGAKWENVLTAVLISIPGVIAALLLSKPIGAYAIGENYAKSLGIKVKPFRAVLILISSLLSACVTALAGPISFVGIAVPHITRSLLKSSNPWFIIPTSFLLGAVFCIFCDLIARTLFAPTDLAIGTVTSVFGAPIVIYMMIKQRKNREA